MPRGQETHTSASGGSFEDFRGDVVTLARMMETSWAASSTAPLLYTPEYLDDCFRYPGATYALAPTLYEGMEPVAFAAGFPRTVRLGSRELRLVIVAFLTVAAGHKSRGYGILAWSELVRRAREAGFDGMVNYCVQGEDMSRMIEGSCRRLGLPVTKVFTVNHLFKVVWSKPPGAAEAVESLSVPRFLELTARVADESAIARIWTSDEAVWWRQRHNAASTSVVVENRAGVVGGIVMSVATRDRPRSLMVEEVLVSELAEDEQSALVERLLAAAVSEGARLVVVPDQGYADLTPFRAAGFLPSPTKIDAYLTVWSGSTPQDALSSFYLDVF